MADVASRDLRNNTRALLERVEAGESITITVDGRPVATLEPAGRRPRFMARDVFVHDVLSHRADPALRADLRELAPDATDGLSAPVTTGSRTRASSSRGRPAGRCAWTGCRIALPSRSSRSASSAPACWRRPISRAAIAAWPTLTRALALDPIPIDQAVAETWARLRVSLRDFGLRDAGQRSWIAATAMTLGIPVVTQDDDYVHVPGLEVIHI